MKCQVQGCTFEAMGKAPFCYNHDEAARLKPQTVSSVQDETNDVVNHPKHYTKHPSGVECIQIVEHLTFNLGNAMKYVWRAGEKDPGKTIEDLMKARWYLEREINKLGGKAKSATPDAGFEARQEAKRELVSALYLVLGTKESLAGEETTELMLRAAGQLRELYQLDLVQRRNAGENI